MSKFYYDRFGIRELYKPVNLNCSYCGKEFFTNQKDIAESNLPITCEDSDCRRKHKKRVFG